MEVAALRKPLTPKESELLKALSKPDATIEVVLPAEINKKDWEFTTGVVCRGIARARMQEQVLLPVLGRLLAIAKENPVITEGFENWEDFLEAKIYGEFGVGRSTVFEATKIVRRLPDLQISTYEAVGRNNLRIFFKAVAEGDENKPYAKKLLEKAAELTTEQLVKYCVEKGLTTTAEVTGASVSFKCNKGESKQFDKFFANEKYQAHVGSGDRAKMLLAAIAEATTEWDQIEPVEENGSEEEETAEVV